MPFEISIAEARALFPQYTFLTAMTPSEQKAAFQVTDKEGNEFCLKIIAPNYEFDRLNREIRALSVLNHKNVVSFEEYSLTVRKGETRHYILEKFIKGNDFTDMLGSQNIWSTKEAAVFFAELLDGLSAVHECKIVHRDLKPSNIRVTVDHHPVIIDFGLARHLALPDATKTRDGAAIGTPAYFAPEQFEGTKHDIDHRTDLFAIGTLFYYALTGSHPFLVSGMNYNDLQHSITHSDDHMKMEAFLKLPKSFRTLLNRLHSKERSRRPATAKEVAQLLRLIKGAKK